ncbi:hypothetical protein FH972_013558 [Carpinus fangiana]|uniref:Uncharacterized protein n=1 Tax=Carpinus fangiana TaxID=176857 RepID=A0A5N6R756_9ROSI|nr:hypothetical protein FH972_013558 [Carpinus fangiana]
MMLIGSFKVNNLRSLTQIPKTFCRRARREEGDGNCYKSFFSGTEPKVLSKVQNVMVLGPKKPHRGMQLAKPPRG